MRAEERCLIKPGMHATHFCASASSPILTATDMGARKMGSSSTMVRLGAGNRFAESLRQSARWGM